MAFNLGNFWDDLKKTAQKAAAKQAASKPASNNTAPKSSSGLPNRINRVITNNKPDTFGMGRVTDNKLSTSAGIGRVTDIKRNAKHDAVLLNGASQFASGAYNAARNNDRQTYQSTHPDRSTLGDHLVGNFLDSIYTVPTGKNAAPSRYNYESTPSSQWRAPQMVAYAQKTGDTAKLSQMSSIVDDRSEYAYNPYLGGRSVLPPDAIQALAPYTKEGQKYDQQWYDENLWLREFNVYTDTEGVSKAQLAKADPRRIAAYWHNYVGRQIKENNLLNEQYGQYIQDFSKYIDDYTYIHGNAPTLDDVMEHVPVSKYSKLAALDESFGQEKVVQHLPMGTYYSNDIIPGLYYAAVNGEELSTDKDYFQYAVEYYKSPAISSPSAQKYEWSNKDLSGLSKDEANRVIAGYVASGDMEQAEAFRKTYFDSMPHDTSVPLATTILDQTIGYVHDDDWFDAAHNKYDPYMSEFTDEEGNISKPNSKSSQMHHACYELYLADQSREYTDTLEEQWNEAVKDAEAFVAEYGAEYDDVALLQADAIYHAVDENDLTELKAYLKNPKNKTTCRTVFASNDNLNAIIERARRGQSVSPQMDYTLDPEYKDFSEDTPVEKPVGYDEDQQQQALDRKAEYDQTNAAVVEAVNDLSNSGAPIAKGTLPVLPESFDYNDLADKSDSYVEATLAKIWSDNKKGDYEEKFGADYSIEDAAAGDPVLSQLDTDNMPDVVTGKDLGDLSDIINMAAANGDPPTLMNGVLGLAIPGLNELSYVLDDMYDRYGMDTVEEIKNAPIDTVTYKTVYEDCQEKGYTTRNAARIAFFAATTIPAISDSASSDYQGDGELAKVATDLMSDIAHEEGARETLGVVADINDDVRDFFQMERAEDELNDDLYGMGRVTDEPVDMTLFNKAITIGSSSKAPEGYQTQTNAFINGYLNGDITAEDIVSAMRYRSRVRKAEIEERMAEEAGSEELSDSGWQVEGVRISTGEVLAPDQYRQYIMGEARSLADQHFIADYSEMSDDLKAILHYDELVKNAPEGVSPQSIVGAALDSVAHPDRYYHTTPLMLNNGFDVMGTLEALKVSTSPEMRGENLQNAQRNGFQHFFDSVGTADNLAFTVYAMLGGEQSETSKLDHLLRTYGQWFDISEVEAIKDAYINGYVPFKDLQNIIYKRRDSVPKPELSWINNPKADEDSIQRLNNGVQRFRTMAAKSKPLELARRLDAGEDVNTLISEYPEEMAGIDLMALREAAMDPATMEVNQEELNRLIKEKLDISNAQHGEVEYTPEQLDFLQALVDLREDLGQTGYLLYAADNKALKDLTNGELDMEDVGLEDYSVGDLMTALDPNWLEPYDLNPGMNVFEVINAGVSGGMRELLATGPKLISNAARLYKGAVDAFSNIAGFGAPSDFAFENLGPEPFKSALHAADKLEELSEQAKEYRQSAATPFQNLTVEAIAQVTRNLATSATVGRLAANAVASTLADGVVSYADYISQFADAEKAYNLAIKLAQRSGMALGSFTNETYQRMKAGYSNLSAVTHGLVDAAIELGTEDLPFEKGMAWNLKGKDLLSRLYHSVDNLSFGFLSFGANTAKNVISEIGEEEASAFLNRIVSFADNIVGHQKPGEAWNNAWAGYSDEVKQTAVATAYSTLLFGVADLGGMTFNALRYAMDNDTAIDAKQLQDAILADLLTSVEPENATEEQTEQIDQTELDIPRKYRRSRKERRKLRERANNQGVNTELQNAVAEAAIDPSPENLQEVTEAAKAQEAVEPTQQTEAVLEAPSMSSEAAQEPVQAQETAPVESVEQPAEQPVRPSKKPRKRPKKAVAQEASSPVEAAQAEFQNLTPGAQQTAKFLDGAQDAQDKAVANRYAEQEAQKAVENDPGIQSGQQAIQNQELDLEKIEADISEQEQIIQLNRAQLNQSFGAAFDLLIAPEIPSPPMDEARNNKTEQIASAQSTASDLQKKWDELKTKNKKDKEDFLAEARKKFEKEYGKAVDKAEQGIAKLREQAMLDYESLIYGAPSREDKVTGKDENKVHAGEIGEQQLQNYEAINRPGNDKETKLLMSDGQIAHAEARVRKAQQIGMDKYADSIQSEEEYYSVEDATAPMRPSFIKDQKTGEVLSVQAVRADNTGIQDRDLEAWKNNGASDEEIGQQEEDKASRVRTQQLAAYRFDEFKAKKGYAVSPETADKVQDRMAQDGIYAPHMVYTQRDIDEYDEQEAKEARDTSGPIAEEASEHEDESDTMFEHAVQKAGPARDLSDYMDEEGNVSSDLGSSFDVMVSQLEQDGKLQNTGNLGVASNGKYKKVGENDRYLIIAKNNPDQDNGEDYKIYKGLTEPDTQKRRLSSVPVDRKSTEPKTVEYAGDGLSGLERFQKTISDNQTSIETINKNVQAKTQEKIEAQKQLDAAMESISKAATDEERNKLIDLAKNLADKIQKADYYIKNAPQRIATLKNQIAKTQQQYNAAVEFVKNYREKQRGQMAATKYVVLDKDAIELGSYQSVGQALDDIDNNAKEAARQKVMQYMNLSPDGVVDLYVAESLEHFSNKDAAMNTRIENSIRAEAAQMAPEEIYIELLDMWTQDAKEEAIRSIFAAGSLSLVGKKELDKFMEENGIKNDSKPRSRDTWYISLEAAYKYLSEEERKKIGITGDIDQYNESAYSNAKKYAKENGLDEQQTTELIKGLQVEQLTSGGKPHYPVAKNGLFSLLITEDRRNDDKVNLYLRAGNRSGGNYSIDKAIRILKRKIDSICSLARGDITDRHGNVMTPKPNIDFIQVKYIDSEGIVHTRKVGEIYADPQDGVGYWIPSPDDLLRFATEITCNFSAYQGEKQEESRVYFKLTPNSLVAPQEYDYSVAENDLAYLATMSEMKSQLDYVKDLLFNHNATGEWRNRLLEHVGNIMYNMSRHKYKEKLEQAITAAPAAVRALANLAEYYKTQMDYWMGGKWKEELGEQTHNNNAKMSDVLEIQKKYMADSADTQSNSSTLSYAEKLANARARYEELVNNPVYAEPESEDPGVFTLEKELLARMFIPYYEKMAAQEKADNPIQKNYVIGSTQLQHLIDKYTNGKRNQTGEPSSFYSDLYILKQAADAGIDVGRARSRAIRAYHRAVMRGMTDEQKIDYMHSVAKRAQTNPDTYIIDPNADYGQFLKKTVEDAVKNLDKKDKARMRTIRAMAGNYKSERGAANALDDLERISKITGENVDDLRKTLKDNIDRFRNPQQAVANAVIDAMIPEETAETVPETVETAPETVETSRESVETTDSSTDSQMQSTDFEGFQDEVNRMVLGDYGYGEDISQDLADAEALMAEHAPKKKPKKVEAPVELDASEESLALREEMDELQEMLKDATDEAEIAEINKKITANAARQEELRNQPDTNVQKPKKAEPITSFRGDYNFLSNFADAPFTWDGRTYKNAEAAFQSAKSDDPAVRDTFSNMSGKDARRAGRSVQLRNDWNNARLSVMEDIIRAKFAQNPELAAKLIATGDADLVEGNTWKDTFWGVDANTQKGENNLGKILMKVRDELRRQQTNSAKTVNKSNKKPVQKKNAKKELMKAAANPDAASSLERIDSETAPFTINLQNHAANNISASYDDVVNDLSRGMRERAEVNTGNEETISNLEKTKGTINTQEQYDKVINTLENIIPRIQNLRSEIKSMEEQKGKLQSSLDDIKNQIQGIRDSHTGSQTHITDSPEFQALLADRNALSRKLQHLGNDLKKAIAEREELKTQRDYLLDSLISNDTALDIINNRTAIHKEAYRGKNKISTFIENRTKANAFGEKILKYLSRFNVYSGENAYTKRQLIEAITNSVDGHVLERDHKIAQALNARNKNLKEKIALLEFTKTILSGNDKQIAEARQQTIDKIMELYPEREYTDVARENYLNKKAQVGRNVDNWFAHILSDYDLNADKDSLFSKTQMDIDILTAAVARADEAVKNYYHNSVDDLVNMFDGGHLPAAILRTNYAILRNAVDKWNPTKPISSFLGNFASLVRSVFNKNAADYFNSMYIEPIRSAEAEMTKHAEQFHKRYDYLHQLPLDVREAITISIDQGYDNDKIRLEYKDIADDVIEGAETARAIFEELNEMINVVYGRNGIDLLKRRLNYVPHIYKTVGGPFEKLFRELGVEPSLYDELPNEMAGRSTDFRPMHQYFRHAYERSENSLEGCILDIAQLLDIYVPNALIQIHQTDNIVRLEDLHKTIDESGNYTDMGQHKNGSLQVFSQSLHNYIQSVAGKKVGFMDRAIESTFKRKAFMYIKAALQLKADSSVIGNLTVAAANFVPITMTFGQMPKATIHAIYDTIHSRLTGGTDREMVDRSRHLVARGTERFRAVTKYQKARKILATPAEATDDIATEILIRALQYNTAEQMGIDPRGYTDLHQQMIQTADNQAINIQASKERGEKMSALNSILFSTVFQFVQEPTNAVRYLFSDFKKYNNPSGLRSAIAGTVKALTALLAMFAAAEVQNLITGRKVTFAPISDVAGPIMNKKDNETGLDVAKKIASNLITDINPFDNLLDMNNYRGSNDRLNIPIIGGIPVVNSIETTVNEAMDFYEHYTNSQDAKKNNTEYNPVETDYLTDLVTIASQWMLGGVAFKRGYDTYKAATRGYTLAEGSGHVKYTYTPTVHKVLRSAAFSPNASYEGMMYTWKGRDTLSDYQTRNFLDLTNKAGYDPVTAMDIVRGNEELGKTKDAISNAEKAREDTKELEQQAKSVRSGIERPADMLAISKEEIEKPYMQTALNAWRDKGVSIYPYINYSKLPGVLDTVQKDKYTAEYMRSYKHILGKYENKKLSNTDIASIQKKLSAARKHLNEKYFGGDE